MTAANAEPEAIRILRAIIEGDDDVMTAALEDGRKLLQLVRVSKGKGGPAAPIERIMALVADHYNLTVPGMLEHKRTRKLVSARQAAMWLCRKVLGTTLEDIGAKFERNHGTVIHACEAVDGYLETDADYRAQMAELQVKAAALCGRVSA